VSKTCGPSNPLVVWAGLVDAALDVGAQPLVDGQIQLFLAAEVVVDAADARARLGHTSAIVTAVNPRAPNTSVAASRMRCWVASVLAQRQAGASVMLRTVRWLPPDLALADYVTVNY
jgi:hypothetical protein